MTSTQDTSTQAALLDQARALVESIVMRRVDADTALIESGLVDSVLAVEIVLQVEAAFGVQLPPTEIAEHLASVAALAAYIADHTGNR
jgi:D-alanine--poly(phosphoribitol) ligase subunit 2